MKQQRRWCLGAHRVTDLDMDWLRRGSTQSFAHPGSSSNEILWNILMLWLINNLDFVYVRYTVGVSCAVQMCSGASNRPSQYRPTAAPHVLEKTSALIRWTGRSAAKYSHSQTATPCALKPTATGHW